MPTLGQDTSAPLSKQNANETFVSERNLRSNDWRVYDNQTQENHFKSCKVLGGGSARNTSVLWGNKYSLEGILTP